MFSKYRRRRPKTRLRKLKQRKNNNSPFYLRTAKRLILLIKPSAWVEKVKDLLTPLQALIQRFIRKTGPLGALRAIMHHGWLHLQNNLPVAGGVLLLSIAAWTASSIFDTDDNRIVLIEQALYPEAVVHIDEQIPAGSNLIQRSVRPQTAAESNPVPHSPGLTVIAIDAGHGGVDPGSIGKSGLTEKEVTLKIAKKVREKLSKVDKLHVALTRYDDSTINIDTRTSLIESIGADYVLSLHLNAIPQEHISLVESYYKTNRRADPNNDDHYVKMSGSKIKASHSLARAVQSNVFQVVEQHNEVSIDAGLKTSPMRILSQNRVPGALLEITCLSNPDEENRLKNEAYLDKLATGIAEGIKEFLQQESASMTASL